MSRAYYLNGQCLVLVRGSTSSFLSDIDGEELGLTDGNGKVTILPNYKHKDVRYDDFGDEIPPEVLWNLVDVDISMTLVHFDSAILSACISESAGGGIEGTLQGAGQPMGAGKPMYDPLNHYITLHLSSPGPANNPWRFKACYLARRPVVIPLSAERSLVQCIWRAIPYVPFSTGQSEMLSKGTVIWDHSPIAQGY